MSEDETIIFEKDNGAWIPRKRFPALMNVDENEFHNTEFVGGNLKLTNSNIIFVSTSIWVVASIGETAIISGPVISF